MFLYTGWQITKRKERRGGLIGIFESIDKLAQHWEHDTDWENILIIQYTLNDGGSRIIGELRRH